MSQRVLVTGAAGRLGSRTASLLHQQGFTVTATDLAAAPNNEMTFIQADLLDPAAATALTEGADAVVHFGNHPGLGGRRAQDVFNENVTMNENVFHAAAECGVKRLVFSSTLQLIGSHLDPRTVINQAPEPSWPLTGDTPPAPSNLYALSKAVTEAVLRFYAERCGIDAVALRFPLLHNHEDWSRVSAGEETAIDIFEGFTGLTYDDAAALVLAILRSDLPGYRCYAPATSHRHADHTMSELVSRFYPDAPRHLDDLVDISRITEETGWQLGDYPHPSTDPSKDEEADPS